MFWSKTWFLLIATVAAVAVAVALLSARPLQRDLERETGARLERAQHSASLLLKVNARKWIDTAAQVATDAVLVEALEQATKGPADLGLVHKTVQERLRYFNDKMKVDLVWATDARGRVIARAGLDDHVYKDGIEGFPLVADALRGFRGDDAWSIGGKLYRVAASPVIARDHYAGSLIVGQEVAGELAQSMKRVLDVDVAFLLRGRVLAGSAQLPVLAQLPLLVDQHFEEMTQNGRSAPLTIDQGGEGFLVVLAPFVGEAQDHKAAYALLVPRQSAVSFGYLAGQLFASDPKTLPWLQLAPIAAGLLLALIIGFLLMRAEVIRPLKRLAREAQSLARGDLTRLDDDRHPGRFGTVARAVNTTLDRVGAAPRLTVTPAREPFAREPRFIARGDGRDGRDGRDELSPEPMGKREVRPEPALRETRPDVSAGEARSEAFGRRELRTEGPAAGRASVAPASPFAPPPDNGRQTDVEPASVPEFDSRATVSRQRPIPVQQPFSGESRPTDVRGNPEHGRAPVATSGPSMPTMQQMSPVRSDTEPQTMGPDFVEAPPSEVKPLLIPHKPPPLPAQHHAPPPPIPAPMPRQTVLGVGAPGPSVQKDPFDDETAVAGPTEALLRAARETPPPAAIHSAEAALDAEFRQVYRDFIETKQACGEPTEGITYDKFSGKLRTNRQQLITRYSCKTVRFQVYVKDGKAALKATPVTS
jgi:hypothetical protein